MGSGPAKRYPGRTTPYVVIACIVAASGGALFGWVEYPMTFAASSAANSTALLTVLQSADTTMESPEVW